MNHFLLSFVTTILQESLNQLAIANRGRHIPCGNYSKASIQNRFKSKVPESAFQELDPFKVAIGTLNAVKLQKDINFLEVVLCKTVYELSVSETWNFLKDILQLEEQQRKEEQEMIARHACNKISLESYRKRMGRKLTRLDMRLRLADEIFADVKNDLKNIEQVNAMELSLVQKWEQTRFEQAKLVHDQDEKELINSRELFEFRRANEQRLIQNVESYNNIQVKSYESQIIHWEQKYTDELKKLNEQIKNLSATILELSKKHDRHCDISTQRQQVIDEYIEEKERERREYEIEQNRIYSAIKIQAWWRGVMVRRHLGPYRRKKKGKKGGKKGK